MNSSTSPDADQPPHKSNDSTNPITIEEARRQAKELIRGFRDRDLNAARRLQFALPELNLKNHVFAADLALKDARRAIAIENGFEDWQQLLQQLANVQ